MGALGEQEKNGVSDPDRLDEPLEDDQAEVQSENEKHRRNFILNHTLKMKKTM